MQRPQQPSRPCPKSSTRPGVRTSFQKDGASFHKVAEISCQTSWCSLAIRACEPLLKPLPPRSEYILWTDQSSRDLIEQHYPWFLDTFDGYRWPIQRADAIRYFVLYHFGGVYFDLDVGCLRRFDPLLQYQVVLPKTIPVGVSNDLMFSAKGHPFMEQAIRHLITFDHSYIMNYPTVMFSTGPMFLSVQYGLYTGSHPSTPESPGGDVRILPKSLYGKNAKVEDAPNAFVSHHYGSSWHSDDAAFILFLGRSGTRLLWVGIFVLILGVIRLFLQANRSKRHPRSLYKKLDWSRGDFLLPHSNDGSYHLDILSGRSSTPTPSASPLSSPPSPLSWIPLVSISVEIGASNSVTDFSSLFKRAGAWARARVPGDIVSSSAAETPRSSSPSRTFIGRGGRFRSTYNEMSDDAEGIRFLLPTVRSKNATTRNTTHGRGRDGVPRLRMPTPGRRQADSKVRLEREPVLKDLEAGNVNSPPPPPPPYGSLDASRRQQTRPSTLAASLRLWSADDHAWGWPASPDSS